MFWCGDSKVYTIRQKWLSLFGQGGVKRIWREEVLCGIEFGIPLCCVVWYIITVYSCLIVKRDAIVMDLFLGENGWPNFAKIQYYKCPLCRVMKHTIQVRVDRWR